jgi:hypothetical protein
MSDNGSVAPVRESNGLKSTSPVSTSVNQDLWVQVASTFPCMHL